MNKKQKVHDTFIRSTSNAFNRGWYCVRCCSDVTGSHTVGQCNKALMARLQRLDKVRREFYRVLEGSFISADPTKPNGLGSHYSLSVVITRMKEKM